MLRWIERLLLGIGIALAAWCASITFEAWQLNRQPIPEPAALTDTLPGEAEAESGAAGSSTPTAPLLPGGWVARLEAPAIGLSAVVLEGTDAKTLARSAGHIEHTALPGESGNVGIAGHRDTTFRPLRNIKLGDSLFLTTSTETLRYAVTTTTVVEPKDVYVLNPTAQPSLTLVTCYPFTYIGNAPHRFIVTATLIGQEMR